MIQDLSRSTSLHAFTSLSDAALALWIKDGYEEFAAYFKKTYLDIKWRNWFLGSLPTIGLGITNNAMESLNQMIKLQVIFSF